MDDGDPIEVVVAKANANGIVAATTIEATTMLGSSSKGADGDDDRRNFIMMFV
jgi:hypothetical protein